MGSWGITMRESDYGLDLLGTIVDRQLKALDFSTFTVADALEVIKADIMEEIRLANSGCSATDLVFYFSENFPHNFTQGVLLIAECLADYYRAEELVVYDYVGENYDPVEHRIREFVVTKADLQLLLEELQSIQNPEHWLYQSWFREETRREWLNHIQSVYQTIKEHGELIITNYDPRPFMTPQFTLFAPTVDVGRGMTLVNDPGFSLREMNLKKKGIKQWIA